MPAPNTTDHDDQVHLLAAFLHPKGGAVTSWLMPYLWIARSKFEPWPGTLYCALGQDTLIVPLYTKEYIMGTRELNAGGTGNITMT